MKILHTAIRAVMAHVETELADINVTKTYKRRKLKLDPIHRLARQLHKLRARDPKYKQKQKVYRKKYRQKNKQALKRRAKYVEMLKKRMPKPVGPTNHRKSGHASVAAIDPTYAGPDFAVMKARDEYQVDVIKYKSGERIGTYNPYMAQKVVDMYNKDALKEHLKATRKERKKGTASIVAHFFTVQEMRDRGRAYIEQNPDWREHDLGWQDRLKLVGKDTRSE